MRPLSIISCLSVAVAFAGTTRVVAQDPWLSLGDIGHPAFLDTTMIARASASVATVKVQLVGYSGAGYNRLETLQVNCRTHESRVLKVEEKQTNERALGELRAEPADSAWHSFARGTLGGRLLGAVCAYLRRGASGR